RDKLVTGVQTCALPIFTFPYSFAADPHAAVHLGFAVATLLVAELPVIGILEVLKQNGVGPGSQVFVTGHSQGAAMATLLRSYLRSEERRVGKEGSSRGS